MSDLHARCPFYPESCEVERHPNMQHKWRDSTAARLAAKGVVERVARSILHVTHKDIPVTHSVTHTDLVTHKHDVKFVPGTEEVVQVETRADKQRRWRKAHAEEYREKNRERMRAGRKAGPG